MFEEKQKNQPAKTLLPVLKILAVGLRRQDGSQPVGTFSTLNQQHKCNEKIEFKIQKNTFGHQCMIVLNSNLVFFFFVFRAQSFVLK